MKYQNPILRGFNPDPSICRVGEDYYLVTSSFEYFPGIPVYHSKDLVNWEQIGNCIERQSQLCFDNTKSSGGIWAPVIRYEGGMFYVTATFSDRGNFIVTSTNPATGWSNPVWVDFSGIDPSIFFEDGEMYYCANDIGERQRKYGGEGISVAKMDKDTGQVVGEVKRIWTGTGGGFLEAPHIYRVGGYYYLFAAEGGTKENHMVTVARSSDLWGPYESCPMNPIMTNRNDTSKKIACSGHCDLVEDGKGNWWIVHLGTRPRQGMSNLGRETFLMPVAWQDGWPVVGKDKKSHIDVEAPIREEQKPILEWNCEFQGEQWEPQWLFRRNPNPENFLRRDGQLILKASAIKLRDPEGSPTLALVRPLELHCSVEARFAFEPGRDGDCAGLVAYLEENFFYRIMKCREGGKNYLVVERQVDDLNVVAYREEILDGDITLKVLNDGNYYHFSYRIAEGERKEVAVAATKFLSTELVGKCFTGTLWGIFAEGGSATSEAIVDYFTMKV